MNLTKKSIRKTFGTHKKYKPGQLVTIDNCIFRIIKRPCGEDCMYCWYKDCKVYTFCHELPLGLYIKPI